MEKQYLKVPYIDKDKAKSLGARWDAAKQLWYINHSADLAMFKQWLPNDDYRGFQPINKTVVSENIALPLGQMDEGIKLTDFLEPLNTMVKKLYSHGQWVKAEIESITKSASGHYYLVLSEYEQSERKQKIASVRTVIWASNAKTIHSKFQQQANQPLAESLQVLFKLKASMHSVYGFSAVVEDVDPTYTLGAMAIKLKEIRSRLIESQLYKLQSAHRLPMDFFRIAVISPQQAHALGDFRRIADPLQALCAFEYFTAQFQGREASQTIVQGLQQILSRHEQAPFDALVIIRGGGAKGDLHYLNEYELAQSVCRFPIPVLVGIGHDADSTILDEVAKLNFSTPTKVAGFIHRHIMDSGLNALNNWQYIQTYAKTSVQTTQQQLLSFNKVPLWVQQILYHQRQKLNSQLHQLSLARNTLQQQHTTLLKKQHQIQIQAKQAVFTKRSQIQGHLPVIQSVAPLMKQQNRQLSELQRRLLLQTKNLVNQKQRLLLSISETINTQAKKRLKEEKVRLNHHRALVRQADPQNILKRGFALVSQQGTFIVRSADLQPSKPFSIRFHDGVKEINRQK